MSSESDGIAEVLELVAHIARSDDDCAVVEHALHESLVDEQSLAFLEAEFGQLPTYDARFDDDSSGGDDILSVLAVEMHDDGACDDSHKYNNTSDDQCEVGVVFVGEKASHDRGQYHQHRDCYWFPEDEPMEFSPIDNGLVGCEVTLYKSHYS